MVLYFGSSVRGRVYSSFNDLRQAPKLIPNDQLKWTMKFAIQTGSDITGSFNTYQALVEARLEKERGYTGDSIGVFHSRDVLTVYEHVPKNSGEEPIRLASDGLADVVNQDRPVLVGPK